MAEFDPAFDAIVKRREGRWGNNAFDPGAETYKGRSRAKHPDLALWHRIDAAKRRPDFPACLEADAELQRLLRASYKNDEWAKIRGDVLPSQTLAIELFDNAVLEGPGAAIVLLQFALNSLNKGARSWPDIPVDGGFGDVTLSAVAACVSKGRVPKLDKTINVLQGAYLLLGAALIAFLKAHPTPAWREEFWPGGWLDRVSI